MKRSSLIALAALLAVPGVASATSQRVNTTVATHAVATAQNAIWLHNVHKAHGTRTSCAFHDVVGQLPHRTGLVWVCTTRVYRHSDYTGRLATIKFSLLMVPRYTAQGYFEDGSGWVVYPKQPRDRQRRSIYMNVLRVTG